MSEEEKPKHEKIIENIYKKKDMMDSYLFTTKFEHEDVLHTAKSSIVDKLGADKAYEHLKTSKGAEEFGQKGAERLEELAIKRFGISKDKLHEFDLSRLVESTYGMNKDNLKMFMNKHGPEFDMAQYREDFLDKHLENMQGHIVRDHLMNYDKEHVPAILKHIGADKYMKFPDELKNDKYKGDILNSVLKWNKGGNPLGQDHYKSSDNLKVFLQDQYKK